MLMFFKQRLRHHAVFRVVSSRYPFESNKSEIGRIVVGVLGSILGFIVGAAYTVLLARILSPGSLGGFAALSGVFMTVTIASTAIQVTTSRSVAFSEISNTEQPRSTTWTVQVLCVGALASVIWSIASISFAELLNLTFLETVSIAPLFIIYPALAISLGKLHGSGRTTAWTLLGLLGSVSRLLFVGITALFTGSIFALNIALTSSFLVLLVVTAAFSRKTKTPPIRFGSRPFLVSLLTLGVFAVLSNIDIVLARMTLESTKSGQYAIISNFTKTCANLLGILGTLLFPKLAIVRRTSRSINSFVRQIILVATVFSILLALPIYYFGRLSIVPIFGSEYKSLLTHLGLASITFVPWTGVYVAVYCRLVESTWRLALLLITNTIISLFLIFYLVVDIQSMLLVYGLTGSFSLLTLLLVPTHNASGTPLPNRTALTNTFN